MRIKITIERLTIKFSGDLRDLEAALGPVPAKGPAADNGKDFDAIALKPVQTPSRTPPAADAIAVESPAAPAAPAAAEDAGVKGRRVLIEGEAGTYSPREAAAMLGVRPASVRNACCAYGQAKGLKVKGRRVRWATAAEPDGPAESDLSPEGAEPAPAAGSAPAVESRPRGDGNSLPFNPNRTGAILPGDPTPSYGAGWRPRTA